MDVGEFDFWSELAERFRSLGGKLENVVLGRGDRGRGMFRLDSSKDARIFCPSELLVPKEALFFDPEEDRIALRQDCRISSEIRSFIESYYRNYSYGGGGHQEAIELTHGWSGLPEDAKAILRENLKAAIPCASELNQEYYLRQFIGSRAVGFMGKSVLAPVWEFVNHDCYSEGFGSSVRGLECFSSWQSDHELVFRYQGYVSSLRMLVQYGFPSEEVFCFSFPFTLKLAGSATTIRCAGNQAYDPSENKHNLRPEGSALQVMALPIACLSRPLALSYVSKVLDRVGSKRPPATVLTQIQEFNLHERRLLLDSLGECSSDTAKNLCRALHHEIRMIEACAYS